MSAKSVLHMKHPQIIEVGSEEMSCQTGGGGGQGKHCEFENNVSGYPAVDSDQDNAL